MRELQRPKILETVLSTTDQLPTPVAKILLLVLKLGVTSVMTLFAKNKFAVVIPA